MFEGFQPHFFSLTFFINALLILYIQIVYISKVYTFYTIQIVY